MSWEDKSRLKRLGDRHNLDALEGYWIKPIKYSIEGEEEINLAKLKLKDRFPKGFIRKLAKKYPGLEKMNPTEMIAKLKEEELEELLEQTATLSPGEQTAHIKLVLLHGIGEHNLVDKDEDKGGFVKEVSQDFVQRICEDRDLAMEMSGVIEDHNRPLAPGSGPKSGTQLNGSAKASSSKKGQSTKTAAPQAT
ncbi:hypothetical protein LCGC14_1126690 [marine sediment metagenome]|uniref:Uncharacterized protein n=1 Tax=marine sediment metagenome TaxID=412755 RepID=A0A0F9Q870_9ZZZZ